MRCLPCGTEMRFVWAVQYQTIVKTHELHTFECPNCKRTERRRVSAHNIGRCKLNECSFPRQHYRCSQLTWNKPLR